MFTTNEFASYKTESVNNYKKSISNNTLKYGVSDTGKLQVVVALKYSSVYSGVNTAIEVD